MNHGLCQKSCGGCTITGDIVGLGGNFLHKLSAHVLKRIRELDIARDGHAIVGDGRSAKLLVQHNIATFRTKGDLNCICQSIHAAAKSAAGIFIKQNFFCHYILTSKSIIYQSITE